METRSLTSIILAFPSYTARRGGLEVVSRHILTACGSSDAKEAKDVFGRPGVRVGVGLARSRPLAVHGVGCPAAGQNLEIGQLSRHYIAEISLNVTLQQPTNKPTNQSTLSYTRPLVSFCILGKSLLFIVFGSPIDDKGLAHFI